MCKLEVHILHDNKIQSTNFSKFSWIFSKRQETENGKNAQTKQIDKMPGSLNLSILVFSRVEENGDINVRSLGLMITSQIKL